ncbi:LysR family transcriptional regulator [Dendrosporobacter sp. 1207_IL3150]|uniref:LysR family transcriptional regulator n=1 Tax=Dendrosporobacter sp. 1207_IL3150 TaxID=3084054 RepID=UPI002FDA8952
MEFRQLETFCTIVKTGSFTQAADLLGYAQSSITTQIKMLETELGTKLFERLGRRVILTKQGAEFLTYAKKIIHLAQEAKDAVSDSLVPKGTLIIGAPDSLCAIRLPKMLREYRMRYPQVEIVLKTGTCSDFRRWLNNNTVDIAFFLDRKLNYPELISNVLYTEPMVIISSPDHPLVSKGKIQPADLHNQYLILSEQGCSYRAILDQMLIDAHVRPGHILELGSIAAIKQCAINGLGITLLSKTAVTEELTSGDLADLNWNGPDFAVLNQVAYHKDKWLSPAISAFLQLAYESIQKNS